MPQAKSSSQRRRRRQARKKRSRSSKCSTATAGLRMGSLNGSDLPTEKERHRERRDRERGREAETGGNIEREASQNECVLCCDRETEEAALTWGFVRSCWPLVPLYLPSCSTSSLSHTHTAHLYVCSPSLRLSSLIYARGNLKMFRIVFVVSWQLSRVARQSQKGREERVVQASKMPKLV